MGVVAGWFVGVGRALDPSKDMIQYVHDKWEANRGFLGGAVFAISQSQDGYLWIGTERGLVRFDGFDFTLIQQPIAAAPPTGPVRSLVTDVEGNMWIRLDGPHLLLYRDGKFEDAVARFGVHELAVTAMSLDDGGRLLLWGPQNRLLRFRNGRFERYAVAPDIPGIVIAAAETPDHKIWLGSREIGIFQIDDGRTTNPFGRLVLSSVNSLLPVENDKLWIGTDSGLTLWPDDKLAASRLSSTVGRLQIMALTKDHQGNVWVGTAHGLARIAPDLAIANDLINLKQDVQITAIFEDRDGEIWYGGPHGLERLRDGMFTGFGVAQGLPSENNGPLYVDSAGRTWFAPAAGGLYWLKDKHVGRITLAGLDNDVIYSISGGDGELWVGRQRGGLTLLTSSGKTFVARTYTQADGLAQNSVYTVHRSRDGTVWAGTVSAGLSKLNKGSFTNYSATSGLQSSAVFSIVEGSDGTMWFGTPSGLASLRDGQWKSIGAADGLPSPTVRSIFEDSRHVMWIATSSGLAYLRSGRVHVPSSLTDALREETLGITEDRQGALWFVTSDHVLQVSRDRLLDGSLSESDVLSYGPEDGLSEVQGVRRDRSMIADSSGRIWISLAHEIVLSDPSDAQKNAAPVNVRIESIAAAGVPVNLTDSLKLAAGTRSITFNYAASNLSAPQRVRFRYKLDHSDQGWSNEVSLRQVVYADLGPGSYLFHVVASNSLGLWNGRDTTVHFVVEPSFWQTWWFRLACITGAYLIALALYQLRMHQLTQQLNVRFQERFAERSRIAQELHDTLLQGVLSASLQLDVAEDQLEEDSPVKPLLRRILQLMAKVTEEGRNALRGLRAQGTDDSGLEISFSRMRQEFALDDKIDYRVIVHSVARPLRPLVRDEVYRIGREALINAFIHAKAKSIEIEVEYASRHLRLIVRDDGCGIDAEVLHAGREGHWGLPGMRERSESIGARLTLRSRVGSGTEVEMTVPGDTAFERGTGAPIPRWLPWLSRERFEARSADKRKRDQK